MTDDPPQHATLHASGAGHRRRLRVNGVVLGIGGHRVFADGAEIPLSRKEFDLLCVLVENAGRVVSRRDLLDTVWHPWHPDRNKTLEVHIRRLRLKLDPGSQAPRIRTVRGLGYIFDLEAARPTGRS